MSIGKNIRKLRVEHGFTQSELAERLNMTSQAVSKWENETSLPDISQIVPIASVFGVSTDMLLDRSGSDVDEAEKIVGTAYSLISSPPDAATTFDAWTKLQSGLKRFPTSQKLLCQSVELGITLALPENGKLYYPEKADGIFRETLRQASLIVSLSKNAADILRARMIMVMLNAAYGDYNEASRQADRFPVRSDLTYSRVKAYIARSKKDSAVEEEFLKNDLFMHSEAILDDLASLGKSFMASRNPDAALGCFDTAIELIRLFFGEGGNGLHRREEGDLYVLSAECQISKGDCSAALDALESMVRADLGVDLPAGKGADDSDAGKEFRVLEGMDSGGMPKSGAIGRVLEKMSSPAFAPLTREARFCELMAQINVAAENRPE